VTEPLFLLDTNICIYLLGGHSRPALDRVQALAPGEVVTSAVAYAEVMIGARARQAEAHAEALFALIPVLPFDRTAALVYARLPFKRGRYDRLIAAHALALDMTLVTNDEIDFADLAGLRVENWTRT
jgi:tRNA(fMet)-specific endonuclease VapC